MTFGQMAKRLLMLVMVALAPSLAFAQGGQFSTMLSSPEPLPNCTPAITSAQRQPYLWDVTAQAIKTCTAINTWSTLGSGGGGGTPASPPFSVQVNSSGGFGSIALGNSGAPLLSGGAGAFAAFGPLNLAGGANVLTGLLPIGNLPGTVVSSVVSDTNVTGSISGQALTLGWTGTLAKTRTLATTVYTDQSNTYSAGPQTFPGGDFFAGGVNNQTGVSYTFVAADINKLVTFNNSGAVAVTLPRATTAGFTVGAAIHVFNLGAGAVTITPTTSTFNGNATVVLNQNQGAFIESDGTNYEGWVSAAPSGSGTVTSIALTVNGTSPSGIFTITGSPITTSGTLNFNLAGTSGGVACFTSGTVLASSAAGAANAVMLWGGTGVCPSATATDTTVTHVLHATNPATFGAIVLADLPTSGTSTNVLHGTTPPTYSNLAVGDLPTITWALPATGTATSVATFPGADLFLGGINHQTGTTYTVLTTDENKLVTFANAGSVAVTLAQATTAGFTAGAYFPVYNIGPGTVTITPTTSTVNGSATLVLSAGSGATIYSDGTNYSAQLGGGGASLTNPMTTLGDMIYGGAGGTPARLAGPTSPNGIPQSLCSTPAGGIAAAPQWCIPGVAVDAQTGTSYNIPITDDVAFLTGNNSSATSWTGFTLANNYSFAFENLGTGLITYTPASGTVNGNATQIIPQNWFGFHYTNNTNTFMPVLPTIQAWTDCQDSVGQHINFTAATGKISCGTTNSGGAPTFPLTVAGTVNSGGIPYANSTTQESFSATLTLNMPVIGGGVGGAPTVGTISGNTTEFATWSGAATASRCVHTDANGNLIIAAADCSTGGSVTSIATTSPITGGTITTTGTIACGTCATTTNGGALSGTAPVAISAAGAISITGAAGEVLAGATPAFTATPVLGTDNSVAGTLQLANGSAAFHTVLGSAATANNTVNFFATAPVTNDLVSCVTSGTTCTFTDSGILGTAAGLLAACTGCAPLVSPSFTTPALGVATATSVNGLSLTANATGFSVAGGTTSKTLTVSNTITLTAGTDSQTAAIPSAATGSTVNVTQTICSGTMTLGTTAMSSGTKFGASASAPLTATCTGAATSDNVMIDFASDPSGVTGYAPSANGTLTIVKWVTANTLNLYQYNDTANSVTPGAMTVNYRVVR